MNQNSRTKNSIINSIYATSSQFLTIIFSFIVRTVFIKMLTAEYLGINGLFSNIITMLSLADLGIGIAIPYTLYKPLAEENYKKIQILMKLYKNIYNIIGVVVLIAGISLTPLLKFIIKDMPDISNLHIIYILFVINAAVSYFFIYKKLLIDSDQKGYIANRIIMGMTLLKSIIEIIILISTKNYILYLLVSIIITIIQNFLISIKCNKLYPYIKEKNEDKIDKKDIRELKNNVSALVIYRIGIVAINGTDNIIISKIIGVVAVGLYSNYLLIESSLTKIVSKVFEAITSSIGNMVVTTDEEKSEDIFYKLMFFNFILYCVFGVCLSVLINSFIKIWIGEKYLLSALEAFAIGLNFYIYGMQSLVSSFRNAYGLFVQGKYRPVIMVIVNILVSVILAKYIGILGVIIGTIISRLFVTGIYDPIIVFKYGLKSSVVKYFKLYAEYLIIFIVICSILMYVLKFIAINNVYSWILLAVLTLLILVIVLIVLFYKNENFKYFLNQFKNIIMSKIGVKNRDEKQRK